MPKLDRFITPSTVKALIDKHLAETANDTARSALLAIRQDLDSLPLTEAIITHHGHWIRYLDGEHIMPEAYYQCSVCGARRFSRPRAVCPSCISVMDD